MRMPAKTVSAVIGVAAALTIALGACSGCHTQNDGNTTPQQEEHECPPCPPCPSMSPPTDPLAGSTLDDGFTDAERTAFIRENVRRTVRIQVANYHKNYGLGFGGGTGVAIRPNIVLTAAHVVQEFRFFYGVRRILGRDNLTIVHPRAFDMRIITKTNQMRDVALLELRDGERIDSTIKMAIGRPVKNGDLLWQFGRTSRWKRGKVVDASNPRRVAVDFEVCGGDSGGPVVWPDGTLAGTILSRSIAGGHVLNKHCSNRGYFINVDEAVKGLSGSVVTGEN